MVWKEYDGGQSGKGSFTSFLNLDRTRAGLHKVYFSGIGGIGVSGLAHLFLDKGWSVSGADMDPGASTVCELIERGARVYSQHKAENISEMCPDLLIYSSAVRRESEDIREALHLGIPLVHRAEALSYMMKDYRGVCVAGMHGKTTVSSILSWCLSRFDSGVGYAVGAQCAQLMPHARLPRVKGKGWFIAETDESDGSLLNFYPEQAFILNLDRDHLDYYSGREMIEQTFSQFAGQISGKIFCCADNPWVMQLKEHSFKEKGITFGVNPRADYRIRNIKLNENSFEVITPSGEVKEFQIQLLGEHNICNAAGVASFLLEAGYSAESIAEGLKSFKGARRRQELLYKDDNYRIIEDYGHHPVEIEATIRAIRQQGILKDGRLLVAFQPHRFSRMQKLLSEFASCFTGVDQLFLTDVYSASEDPIPGVSGQMLANAIQERGQAVEYRQKLDDVRMAIESTLRPGDTVLFLGAGDISNLAHQYVDLLKHSKEEK